MCTCVCAVCIYLLSLPYACGIWHLACVEKKKSASLCASSTVTAFCILLAVCKGEMPRGKE